MLLCSFYCMVYSLSFELLLLESNVYVALSTPTQCSIVMHFRSTFLSCLEDWRLAGSGLPIYVVTVKRLRLQIRHLIVGVVHH